MANDVLRLERGAKERGLVLNRGKCKVIGLNAANGVIWKASGLPFTSVGHLVGGGVDKALADKRENGTLS